MRWYTRLRRFTGRNAGSLGLFVFGAGEVVAGVVIRNDPAVAIALIVTGTGAAAFSALSDIEEADVDAASGKLKIRRRAREATAALASGHEPPQLPPASSAVTAARYALAAEALRTVLNPSEGPLAGATLHLYLYDEQRARLLALGVDGPPGIEGWAVGQGATGVAYASGEYVLVEGDAVHDATYGLTPEQQERARDLTLVAAMPVRNANARVIGVLTASSEQPNQSIASEDGFDAQLAAADMAARLLIDVLQWFSDAYDEDDG